MRFEFQVDLKPVLIKAPPKAVATGRVVPAILEALVMAYQVADYMTANKLRFNDFGRHAEITSARVSQIMSLLLLAPSIQEEILQGETPGLHELAEADLRPLLKESYWPRQEAAWRSLLRSRTPTLVSKGSTAS